MIIEDGGTLEAAVTLNMSAGTLACSRATEEINGWFTVSEQTFPFQGGEEPTNVNSRQMWTQKKSL